MLALAVAAWVAAVPLQEAPRLPVSPAGAVEAVQYDLVKYKDRVERDGTSVRTTEVQVRLQTSQGVATFGQIGEGYLEGYGEVRFEEVVIRKADGRQVAVTNGLVEEVNPFGVTATSVPADLRYKKLTIPGLEPGDRLSYRLVHRQKPLAPGRAFGEMKLWLEPGAPVRTYELDLPRDARIKVRLRKDIGAQWEEVPSPADRLVRRLSLGAVPSGPREKVTKESLEKLSEPDVIFTSFDSWSDVAGWWWGISKDRLAPDAAVAKEASSLVASAKTPREKLEALLTFLTVRIRYVNVSFGLGRMQPRKAREVLDNRYGDCKDKHALLAALGASLGIDVRPVLINSGRPALLDDVPSPQQFDHVISVARLGTTPEEWLWLDGTNPFGGLGYLLPTLRDKPALLVEANGDAVVVRTPTLPPFLPRQEMVMKGTLSPEGVLRGRVTWTVRSDGEMMLRSFLAGVSQEQRASGLRAAMALPWGGGKIENVVVSDPLDVSSPLRVEFDAEKTIEAKDGELGLLVPFPDVELPVADNEVSAGGPAVTFPLREITERAEIELPEGLEARSPLSVSMERPFGTFRSTYSIQGRLLRLERSVSLPQPSLPATDVASYEAFRNAIGKDHDQKFAVTGVTPAPAIVTAKGLHQQGLAAFKKKDYAKAAELLAKATETDPKVEDGFRDLGRAYSELRRYDEAAAAFGRQIEVAPFHEDAYAWRAYALLRLGMGPLAERDLLKQIEVAPFRAWSYEELGKRRTEQGQHAEAADLYGRAATLEPKMAARWVTLARAQAAAGQPDEARKSLQRSAALDPADWLRIQAAGVYHSLGDFEAAARLAADALPSLTQRLAKLKPATVSDSDHYWVSQLIDAWRYVGEAALVAGDMEKAERYLQAAWSLDFSPEAGWKLGDLREKQGRLDDAVEFWSMASLVPRGWTTLPNDFMPRIEAASARLPEIKADPRIPRRPQPPGSSGVDFTKTPRQDRARNRLLDLRTIRVLGPCQEDFVEEVLLLADTDGRVERILNRSRTSPEAFDRQVAKLGPIRLEWTRPDALVHKATRRGLLACSRATGCGVVLDLPGQNTALAAREATPQFSSIGSITLAKLEPQSGSTLRPGEAVEVVATGRFAGAVEGSVVGLVVQDQTGLPLTPSKVSQVVTAGEGEVTLKAAITVPTGATRIDVFLPLYPAPGRPTSTVATATYDVRKEQ